MPKGKAGDEGVAVAHGKPLEPPSPQLRGGALGKAAAHLLAQFGGLHGPPLQEDGSGKAGKAGVQVVPLGDVP